MNANELLSNLKLSQKKIPSKFFYDDRGSQLFSRITELTEYYPTRCEDEILENHASNMLSATNTKELVLVELGAGDGRKTKHLLRAAQDLKIKLKYVPVDISSEALRLLCTRLNEFDEHIQIAPMLLDLETQQLPIENNCPHMIAYLGSSIGNSEPDGQTELLRRLNSQLRPGDFLLMGFDLKKDPEILMAAYDDDAGVTKEFNLNLLKRFNREFQADFDRAKWRHKAAFNPHTGAMESYLVSRYDQVVTISGETLHFKKYEAVQTEVSWKFSKDETRALAKAAGFSVVREWTCSRDWFMDSLFLKSPKVSELPSSLHS